MYSRNSACLYIHLKEWNSFTRDYCVFLIKIA